MKAGDLTIEDWHKIPGVIEFGFGNQCYPWRSQLGYKSRDRTPPASEDGPIRDDPDRGAHEAATSPNRTTQTTRKSRESGEELLELQERFKGKSFLQFE